MLRKTWKAHNAFNHAYHAAVTAAAPPRALPCLHRLCLPGGTVSAPLAPCAYMLYHVHAHDHMRRSNASMRLQVPVSWRARVAQKQIRCGIASGFHPVARGDSRSSIATSRNRMGFELKYDREPRVANRSTVTCKRHLLQHLCIG
jgi:hypothetical protein